MKYFLSMSPDPKLRPVANDAFGDPFRFTNIFLLGAKEAAK